MNVEAWVCRRCGERRFLYARDVVDAAHLVDRPAWKPRPVRRHPGEGTIGRFETLTCRACGLTEWIAIGWGAPPMPVVVESAPGFELGRRPCAGCSGQTLHDTYDAVEHHEGEVVDVRLPSTLGGAEAAISVCRACGVTLWSAVHWQRRAPSSPEPTPCLDCASTSAFSRARAREADGDVPIALAWDHRFFTSAGARRTYGRYDLRLCRACGALEWYALDPEKLEPDPEAKLFAVESGGRPALRQGPYR